MNFKTLQLDVVARYKELPIRLSLDEKLDLKVSEFTNYVYQTIGDYIESSQLNKYDNPVIFQIHTDLPRSELKMIRDIIIAALVKKLVKDPNEFKHGERRLGIPSGLQGLEIMSGHIMDLINYPLLKEEFEIQFYDDRDRLYKPVIKPV
jgi:hypothetical protein